ncbi:hypothetical protein Tsubulata_000634 [Turnera subulata]|uniref:Uncharacterized protein n=1 Tax=Turnera subulata TaxID=218843 RepID=A0A9Q0GI06_9ROSI|nr:hypothetical protein Tsubulata_000634 [Turnera subulata]
MDDSGGSSSRVSWGRWWWQSSWGQTPSCGNHRDDAIFLPGDSMGPALSEMYQQQQQQNSLLRMIPRGQGSNSKWRTRHWLMLRDT